jgi:lipoprotein-anchoring transpeptidase ErfK/SrfK
VNNTDVRTRTRRGSTAALAGLSIALVTACAAGPAPVGTGRDAPAATGGRPTAGAALPGAPVPGPITTTVATGTATVTVPTTAVASTGPAASAAADGLLRRGDTGAAVRAVQQRLTDLGYWLGPTDGTFGPLTQQAVYALQGAAGLTRDGIVGPKTRAALDAGTRPQARSDRGTVTEVDRDAGLVMFVRDGQVQLALHTSTGTFEPYTHDGRRLLADTPEGHFSVSWTYDGWRDGALGNLYRPRYFHPDGIAVHGYPSVPAYPASHGCVRVTGQAMDLVWARDLMPVGSVVWVY